VRTRCLAVLVTAITTAIAWTAASTTLALCVACVFAGSLGWWMQVSSGFTKHLALPLWAAVTVLVGVMAARIGVDQIGGLMLSVLMTALASVLSLPIAVLLALGRRSRFAALRVCCAAYVELMRSLPLSEQCTSLGELEVEQAPKMIGAASTLKASELLLNGGDRGVEQRALRFEDWR
jgi:general L-amino acid transport system permease protein